MPIDENGIITPVKTEEIQTEISKENNNNSWDKKRLIIEIIVNIVLCLIGLKIGEEKSAIVYNGNNITYEIYVDTINSINLMNEEASKNTTGDSVAFYAKQFVGNPYVYGGSSLTDGADASGFVSAIYATFGFALPHSSAAIQNIGEDVSIEDIRAGDIVCYAGHVGIYLGDGEIVHASTPAEGIIISNMTYRPVLSIRRIISDNFSYETDEESNYRDNIIMH